MIRNILPKSVKSALIVTFSFVYSVGYAQSKLDLDDYRLVFSDEFNENLLDNGKWNTGFLWGPYLPINNEQQLYVDVLGINANSMNSNGGGTPNPFELTGNSLKINAIPVPQAADADLIPSRPDATSLLWNDYPEYRYNPEYDSSRVNFLSGVITSYDSFRFTYGYAEARVKFPDIEGVWPAFWLLNSFYVEDLPEIDIAEYLGGGSDTLYQTYHYFEPENNWAKISTPTFDIDIDDLTNRWVTVGVHWGIDELTWYINGQKTYSVNGDDYQIPKQAMYVIANLAVGGNWPDLLGYSPNAQRFPASYEIDYIRVYQSEPPSVITPEVLANDYKLTFEDEFSGSNLDLNKWNTSFLWGPYYPINDEKQFYPDIAGVHSTFSQNPIEVSGGTLKLTAYPIDQELLPSAPDQTSIQFENNPSWQYNNEFNNLEVANPWIPDYVSGLVTTYDSFKFVNGYAEIRAKLPLGDGAWPAFWLLNSYYVDEQPEIDVMEFRGENTHEVVHSYHYYDSGILNTPVSTSTQSQNTVNGFADNEFHTFGVSWHPGKLDWYVNGNKVFSYDSDNVSSQLAYAILNLAIEGNFNYADANPLEFPKVFEIDYIRIYQLDTAPPAPQATAALVLPEPNSTLSDWTTTFEWDPADISASAWALWLGSEKGAYDIAKEFVSGEVTSHTITNLPTDGSTVYVRFWKNVNGWQIVDEYEYTASIESPGL